MSLTNKVHKTSKIDALIKANNDEMLDNSISQNHSEKLKVVRVKSPKKTLVKDSVKRIKRRG